jgi:hypothetical protein
VNETTTRTRRISVCAYVTSSGKKKSNRWQPTNSNATPNLLTVAPNGQPAIQEVTLFLQYLRSTRDITGVYLGFLWMYPNGTPNAFETVLVRQSPMSPLNDDLSNAVYRGSCMCGDVTYAVTGRPLLSAYCHCTICQRLNREFPQHLY